MEDTYTSYSDMIMEDLANEAEEKHYTQIMNLVYDEQPDDEFTEWGELALDDPDWDVWGEVRK